MPDSDPTLADRLEEWALSERLVPFGVKADLRAAAARLREQDAEITRLRRICEPLDGNILQARLDKLDRIEAALGDVWTADEIRWAVGDGRVVKMAYHPLDEMLRRLADALDEGDQ